MPSCFAARGNADASFGSLRWTGLEKRVLGISVVTICIGMMFPYAALKPFLGAVLAATFAVASVRALYLGVVMFILILPLQALIENNSWLIRGLNLQSLFLIWFLSLSFFHRSESGNVKEAPRRNPMLAPLFALIVIVVISAFRTHLTSSESLLDLLSRVKNWFCYAVFAWLCFKHIHAPREKKIFLFAVLFSTTVNAAYSMRDIVTNPSLHLEGNRAVSLIAIQPNLYGGFLTLYSFLFLATLVQYPLRWRGRLVVLAAACLVLTNLVYTLSRGAWLAFLVGAIVTSFFKARKLMLPLVVLSAIVFPLLPQEAEQRWREGMEGEYDPRWFVEENVTVDDAASRIIQWRTFPGLLAERPLFGFGFDTYGQTIYRRGIDDKPRSAHSSLIEIGVEEGVPGLLCYLWLLVSIWRAASATYRRTRGDPLHQTLALWLLAATVALFVLDLTGTRFRNSSIMAYYWILSGVALNAVVAGKATGGTSAGTSRDMR